MKNVLHKATFELCPINPNANGVYYKDNSYDEVITDFFSRDPEIRLVFDKYGKGRNYIGRIEAGETHHTANVYLKDNLKDIITPEKYYIGFAFEASNIVDNMVTLKSAVYTVPVSKDIFKTDRYLAMLNDKKSTVMEEGK